MTADLEFSRPFDVRRMAPEGATETISATLGECQAIALRIGVQAVHSVSATIKVQPWKQGRFRARGDATATLVMPNASR